MDRRRFLVVGAAVVMAGCARGTDPNAESGSPTADPSSTEPAVTTETTGSAVPSTTSAGPSTSTGASTTQAPTAPTAARFVTNGARSDDRVALTFHTNGDLGLVDRLLAVLGERRVPITAFMIGSWLEANPAYARRYLDAGHELANHTYTHPTLHQLAPAAIAQEITKCRGVLERLGGAPGRWFRPSGTDDGMAEPAAAIMAEAGRAGYGWVAGFDVDPLDYKDPAPTTIASRTAAALRPGAIVSLHAGHANTVTAMPAILDELANRKLRAVTLSDLIGG